MKKLVISTLLIFGLVASNHGKPIVDIYSYQDPLAIEDEAYIDDIPFSTWEIAVGSLTDGDEYKMAEEAYIDDIPFDTKAIVNHYILLKLEDNSGESSINDIPFNTEKIMYEELAARLTERYREEQNICDFPVNSITMSDNDHCNNYLITIKE
jgi:hypothetical protein